MQGYIKLYRKILENPVVTKDSDFFAIWTYLLLNASHNHYEVVFEGSKITLNPGQLITGRKSIATFFTNISESKVQRVLKTLENERQIEQQTTPRNRLITIVNWIEYQQSEQQNEQQVNNKRTTNEQQVNTTKNVKNVKNVKNNIYIFKKPQIQEIRDYCLERKNNVDADKFYNYYESNGWKVGRNSMKDWKAAIRTWERNTFSKDKQKKFESETNKPYENLF